MAKIPLRVYTKEIENLIERGEIEQAVSHAKNILKTYPKHIETYRLLGKAYLESQRYAEAADILQRVLSVIPDDFISQIGMSIIREDEGNLDAAIWHMERAYEVQPFNPAVQDELRRLYGRRDGVEPPKIRLTRGALIRMYARGELYPQAIAETRAALTEDPQRADLRVLLARLYFLSDHKNDAAAVCSELISKLPYCYEANCLLTQILPGTTRAEEAKKFQQRIYTLDPYEAFISPSAPTSDQVPDQAIMIEPVADSSTHDAQTPAWANTVGIQWEESQEEVIPDWLNTLPTEKPTADIQTEDQVVANIIEGQSTSEATPSAAEPADESAAQAEAAQEDAFPDWMKQAGWSKSEHSADEIMAAQLANQPEEEIIPAEIPDWLKSIAPQEEQPHQENTEAGAEWFDSLLSTAAPTAGENEEQAGSTPETGFEALSENFTEEDHAQEAENDLPDWLSRIAEEENSVDYPPEPQPTVEFEDLPDWAKSGEPAAEQSTGAVEDNPDWLKALEKETEQPPANVDQPDWVASLSETPPSEATPEVNTDWLNALEPRFDKAEPQETNPLPDNFVSAPEEAPLENHIGSEIKAEEESSAAASSMPDLSDTDAMMAWLESLAAKQGADEATLMTPPEQRTETPPDWVKKEIELEQTSRMENETLQPVDAAAGLQDTQEIVPPSTDQETYTATAIAPNADPVALPPAGITKPPSPVEEEGIPFDLNDDEASMAWMGNLITNQDTNEADRPTITEQNIETPDLTSSTVGAATQAATEPVMESQPESLAQEPAVDNLTTPQVSEAASIPEAAADPSLAEPTQPVKVAKEVSHDAEVLPTEEVTESGKPAVASVVPDYNDTDAMMAWLESLAAKQGADEATLMTPPEQRTETPPEWVKKEIETEKETGSIAETSEPADDQEELPDWLRGIEEENETETLPAPVESASVPDEFRAAWAPEADLVKQPSDELTSSTGPQAETDLKALHEALQHGNVENALQGYNQHINNGTHLEEMIQNLRDALYRYPVDINIWQTLGDAYARNNQLQEALDAYAKAEELLR